MEPESSLSSSYFISSSIQVDRKFSLQITISSILYVNAISSLTALDFIRPALRINIYVANLFSLREFDLFLVEAMLKTSTSNFSFDLSIN